MEEKKYDIYWEVTSIEMLHVVKELLMLKKVVFGLISSTNQKMIDYHGSSRKKMTWWKDRKLRKRINEYTR